MVYCCSLLAVIVIGIGPIPLDCEQILFVILCEKGEEIRLALYNYSNDKEQRW